MMEFWMSWRSKLWFPSPISCEKALGWGTLSSVPLGNEHLGGTATLDKAAGGVSIGLSSNLKEPSYTSTSSLKYGGEGSGTAGQGDLHCALGDEDVSEMCSTESDRGS